jgi:hypothetical protein
MSFTSLIFSASTNEELVTMVAQLGDANTKEHFVIIRGNGKLKAYDSASEFVDDALSFFSKGYASTSMSLNGKIYSYSEEEVKALTSYLSALLRSLRANKVN